MKNKITLLNMISSLLLQICTIVSGFIVPRVILSYFGSDVNGLVSSIGQFLSYISLVEGGIGAVILANLYKPLINKDNDIISSVMVTAKKFYKKIGVIFICYSLILSVAYPIVFETGFSFGYVCSLTLILSLATTIQYMFAINFRMLLYADKKVYIVSFLQIAIVILNIFLIVLSVYIYPNIHILKLITAVVYVIQPIYYGKYVKKYYHIDWKAEPNNNLIRERWNGFAINTAAFIHNCTDIAVLTILTDLKTVSVYSVYSLITNGIKQLIISLLNGLDATLGQAYAKGDTNELNQKIDLYEFIVMCVSFFLYTITALFITPFVMIYTKGITDANYYQPVFGVLLVISETMYIVKFPHMNLAYSANKFKEITIPAYVEAGLNILISVSLVYKFGLIGVAIGTIVAMVFRTVFHVYFTTRLIEGRAQSIFYKKFFAFLGISVLAFFIGLKWFPVEEFTFVCWITKAVICSIIYAALMALLIVAMFKSEAKYLINYLRKKQ